jgi:hypothetical protein
MYNYIFITMQPRSPHYEICTSSQLIKILDQARQSAKRTAGKSKLLTKVRSSLFTSTYKMVKNKDLTSSLLRGTLNQRFRRSTVKEDCF